MSKLANADLVRMEPYNATVSDCVSSSLDGRSANIVRAVLIMPPLDSVPVTISFAGEEPSDV